MPGMTSGSPESWVDARLRALGLAPSSERRIVKHGPISLIWRQPMATGRDVFFKEVPPLFAVEPPLTEWLSRRWPASLPEVLATERTRRWLLTRAVEGIALSEIDAVDPWVSAIRALARIQIEGRDQEAELIACGCPLRGLGMLADELDLLLSEAIPLCAKHTIVPDGLVRAVHAARDGLLVKAARLDALGVPTTLIHGDFVANNVIVSSHDGTPVILDWTDGARAHPFFDLLIFLRGRAGQRVAAHHDTLVRAYLSEWTATGLASPADLHEAFTIAQRLAPLYHASSYRRIVGLGAAAVAEFAETMFWLLGLLVEAREI
jgi:hypothetical protein